MRESVLKEIRKAYMQLLTTKPLFFTAADYSIEQFAADLGTNRSYASRFVNRELGVTFPVLLNKLRIAHLIRRKSENPKACMKSLAEECGFNCPFSLRRAFQKEYGMLPSEYFRNMEL